jgi:hypothetical protein
MVSGPRPAKPQRKPTIATETVAASPKRAKSVVARPVALHKRQPMFAKTAAAGE